MIYSDRRWEVNDQLIICCKETDGSIKDGAGRNSRTRLLIVP